jgi:hypothetical protein
MPVINGVTIGPEGPVAGYYSYATLVTASNTAPLPGKNRALYVGTGGNLTVVMASDPTATPILFMSVPAGTTLPISVSYVMATGTVAAAILALY